MTETIVLASAPKLASLLEPIAEALGTMPEVAAAYVYGSVARETATPLSDVDVAVLTDPAVEGTRRGDLTRKLTTLLERRCPGFRFEVRLFDELPVALRGRVVSEGIRVVDRNSDLRVRAEVRARMEYFDFLEFERAGAQMGLEGLREKLSGG